LKNISVKEYATLLRVNKTAIIYRLANNISLPGVQRHEKIGNSFVLLYNEATDIEEAKKEFRKK